MEERSALQVQIDFIEKELKSLSTMIVNFMGKQDGRFESIDKTYVRNDMFTQLITQQNKTLDEIKDGQKELLCQVNKHEEYMPMLADIKKERESIKNVLITWISKGIFWTAITVTALYAIFKN